MESTTENASHAVEKLTDERARSVKPTWDEYYLGIAEAASRRSSCDRSKVGAVVVSKHNRIASLGYNDAPAGMPGCSTCPRRTSDCAPGSDYSNCVAVHAEANALLYCDREDLINATLYITREPCYGCQKLIAATGIVRVVTPEGQKEISRA